MRLPSDMAEERRSEGESLTFHQQRARHLGRSELILGATNVTALVHTTRVDDLQRVVTQNHNSVKDQKCVFKYRRRPETRGELTKRVS